MDPLESFDFQFELTGRLELILPDQSKVNVTRAVYSLQAEPEFQNLELKLELVANESPKLQPFFDLDPAASVQRFRMRDAVLKALLPQLAENPEADAMLQADSGALLKLENYLLIGASVWLDQTETLF